MEMNEKQIKAIKAGREAFSARLDRINRQLNAGKKVHEDYSGHDMDLFDAFHDIDRS